MRDDITHLSREGIPFLYIADANWGMLKRDVNISRHIADCERETGVPLFVDFSAAKNSPDRVTELMSTFREVDVLSAQPISMQSLSNRALELVDRKNIKPSGCSGISTSGPWRLSSS